MVFFSVYEATVARVRHGEPSFWELDAERAGKDNNRTLGRCPGLHGLSRKASVSTFVGGRV